MLDIHMMEKWITLIIIELWFRIYIDDFKVNFGNVDKKTS